VPLHLKNETGGPGKLKEVGLKFWKPTEINSYRSRSIMTVHRKSMEVPKNYIKPRNQSES
jgi:hypothetical protein